MSFDPFSPAHCRAALGPVTAALRAKRALAEHGIPAEVVSLAPEESRRGCAFGIEFPCIKESAVRSVLRGSHISVSEYLKEK